MRSLFGALVALAVCQAASAQTISSSSLQQINGSYGGGTAVTTTDATGTRTTVTGPAGSANRASGMTVIGQWYQANIGAGGTAGITTDYASNGSASAFFSTTNSESKADLQYNFGSATALSQIASVSFDFYRDGSSTTGAQFAPVLRLDVRKNGAFAGSLVLENIYQGQASAPVNSWTTVSATLDSGIFWATNASLGPTFASSNGGQKTLSAWIAANSSSNLTFTGASIGVGTGFSGMFAGGVDNVSVRLQSSDLLASNFETGVPEPGTWAMMLVGFGVVGWSMRRRGREVHHA